MDLNDRVVANCRRLLQAAKAGGEEWDAAMAEAVALREETYAALGLPGPEVKAQAAQMLAEDVASRAKAVEE